MAPAVSRIILYVVIIAGLLPVLALTWGGDNTLLSELGRSAAVAGFTILAMQVVLAGRFRWALPPFGLDAVARFPRSMAVIALALVVFRPPLLAAVILVTLLGMSGAPHRLAFERRCAFHDIQATAVMPLALMQTWSAGGDLRVAWIRWIWIIGAAVSLIAYFYHRLVRPFILSRRSYRVAAVREESPLVRDLTPAPPERRGVFDYLPEQFQLMAFHRDGTLAEGEHRWNISPDFSERESANPAIEEAGGFRAVVGRALPSGTAMAHAPFERFSYIYHPYEKDLVFIAGGTGITPLIAMIRRMRDAGSDMPVLLVYTNRDRQSIAFRSELEDIARGEHPRLRVIHILSKPGKDWDGETGYLDGEKLGRFCDRRFDGRGFYVCGPPSLLKSVMGALESRSVPCRHIHMQSLLILD
jgi:predicted ferric reductase